MADLIGLSFRGAVRALAVAAVAATMAAICLGKAQPILAQVPLEQAVKANFLYKFAPFVEWPDNAFAPGNPFMICVIGEDDFGRALDQAVRGQSVNGRPIAVKRISTVAALPPCNILYLGRTGRSTDDILRAAAAYPILTVTDRKQNSGGGMIDFVLRSGRVRFTIDAAAARARGLQISSKLLGLALSVAGR
jgi:hypothetical protein